MELVCRGLWKIYPDGTEALRGVDLRIGGGLFGLLGPNGAGKTTLMEIVALLLEPTRGTVTINGCDIMADHNKIRPLLGYLPQNFGFFPELTAREFLEFLGSMRGLGGRALRDEAQRRLETVRLQHVAHKRLKTFSGGMLRRVGIAQALLGDPQLIVVDEPTAALDPEERVNFRNLLFELGRSRSVILSTHIVKDIEETCARMALVHKGEIRYQGEPSAFIRGAEGRIWEFWGGRDDMERLAGAPNLVSIQEDVRGVRFRVVSPGPPAENAVQAPPNLEDAYVHFLETETKPISTGTAG